MSDQVAFFSVDIETTTTEPPGFGGVLLSVGIVPVLWEVGMTVPLFGGFEAADTDDEIDQDGFYQRIDQWAWLATEGWYDGTATSETYKWWVTQNDQAQDEAWRDQSLPRSSERSVALSLVRYVERIRDGRAAHFVANPVSFDKPWIDYLLMRYGLHNPFHYRSLCLRSMRFGSNVNEGFGSVREQADDPVIPHHAYYDALAQAQDLVSLLGDKT